MRETFTVRKHSFGVGVERTFPVHSPKVERIEVAARGDVRRAKLYYLRGRVGRRARVRERQATGPDRGSETARAAVQGSGASDAGPQPAGADAAGGGEQDPAALASAADEEEPGARAADPGEQDPAALASAAGEEEPGARAADPGEEEPGARAADGEPTGEDRAADAS